jgi:hypothetical protein
VSPRKASRPTSAGTDREPRGDLGGHQVGRIAIRKNSSRQVRSEICTAGRFYADDHEPSAGRSKSDGAQPYWIVGRDRLVWRTDSDGQALYYGKVCLARVISDLKWPGMFRVLAQGECSDLCNLSRARDAAMFIALENLNSEPQERPCEARRLAKAPRQ